MKKLLEVFDRMTPEEKEEVISYGLRLLEEQKKAAASPRSGDEPIGRETDLA